MALIGQRLFTAGGNDKYLSLGSEEFVRPFSTGIYNSWTILRIGFLWAINNRWGAYSIAPTQVFYVGLCSGVTNTVGSASTTNFIGSGFSATGWTYTANSGNPYYANAGFNGVRKLLATPTTSATGTIAINVAATTGATLQRRSVFYIDITQSSATQFTVINYYNATNQFTIDTDYNGFLEGLENVGTPIIRGNTLAANSLQTLTCDQNPGVFDTVNLLWGSSVYPLEIYAVGVYRMS